MTTKTPSAAPSLVRSVMRIMVVAILLVAGYQGYLFASKAYAIANPIVNVLPLPASHIGLNTPEGIQLIQNSPRYDYVRLKKYFKPQQYRSYCGVASGSMIANALLDQDTFTQDSWFDGLPAEVRSAWETFFGGMTLEQFSDLMKARGFTVSFHHGGEGRIGDLRSLLKTGVSDPHDMVVLNYSRKAVNQKGWGHFSPVAGYHAASDRVLILDVAAHKYEPSWVPLKTLWAAMATPDSDSGKNRGYAVIAKPDATEPKSR